jgi:hypothetical protein
LPAVEGGGQSSEPPEPVAPPATAEILALEADLERAKNEAAAALDVIESRLAEADERLETELERVRRETEERVRAEIRGQAEERTRVEVDAVRRASEERFNAEIRLRDQELESEREDKARVIEESDARLHEIEQRALAAAERVAAREAELTETKAAIEAELAAARGELEEAHAVAAELERRALDWEREARLREAEERIGVSEVTERAVSKRVYQIAKKQDVSSKEVLEALRATGAEVRAAAANIDEQVALKALEDAGARQPVVAGNAAFAELAAEAERIGPDRPGSEPADEDLEPPDWVVDAAPPGPEVSETADPETSARPGEGSPAGPYSLSSIGLGQLRGLGMSMTQAKRVLRYRDERGGFRSLDELDRVPGFPKPFLTEVKQHLVL